MSGSIAERMQALVAGDGDERQALPGCAWAVVRENDVELGAVGFADPLTRRPLTPTTAMRVASISKIATALCVLSLADERALSLDEDIAARLGPWARNPHFPDAPITVRHLLSHTASIRDGEIYWAHLGQRTEDFFTPGAPLWEGGAHWNGEHPPGAYFTYSNLGFVVLGALVERASGARFDLFAHERVLAPAGAGAGFNWSEMSADAIAAGSPVWTRTPGGGWEAQVDAARPAETGRSYLNPDHRPLTDYRIGENGALFSPQGGLRASAAGLAALATHIMAPAARALHAPTWRANGANGDTQRDMWRAYGLGVQIIEPGEACPIEGLTRPLSGHSGDAYGFRGGLWTDPDSKCAFVYLMNGGPPDGERTRGARSGFSRAEETALQCLHAAVFA